MAVDKEQRARCREEIASLLEKHGKDYEWAPVLARYPDVPKATFYRWVNQLHGSGVPGQNAIRKAKKKAKRKAKQAGSVDAVRERALEQVKDQLPQLPDIPDGKRGRALTMPDLLERLGSCIARAEQLEAHALGEGGKVRNAKLLLQASEHMRRTADTIARLNAMLWDVQRTETLHRAIFTRLRERDPELVLLILQDLKQLNRDIGIQV